MRDLLPAFARYLREEKKFSEHTVNNYLRDLEQFCNYLKQEFGTEHSRHLTTDHIRSWIMWLTERGLAATSIARKVSAIRSCLRFAVKKGLLTKNPATPITLPSRPVRHPSFVPKKEMQRLVNLLHSWEEGGEFEGVRNSLIVKLLYATGMRVSELVALHDDDIDASAMYLRVHGKGKKTRLVPIGTALFRQIREYQKLREETTGITHGPLLVTRSGKPIYPRLVQRIVREVLAVVPSLARKSPHTLRHTFATHLLDEGADLVAIAELLGHASLASTQVYTHTSVERLKRLCKELHPRST